MLNKIDFSDPSFVMNRFLSLEKAVAALEAEVASLRINQQAHGASPSGNAAPCAKCKFGLKPYCYRVKKCDETNGWRHFTMR